MSSCTFPSTRTSWRHHHISSSIRYTGSSKHHVHCHCLLPTYNIRHTVITVRATALRITSMFCTTPLTSSTHFRSWALMHRAGYDGIDLWHFFSTILGWIYLWYPDGLLSIPCRQHVISSSLHQSCHPGSSLKWLLYHWLVRLLLHSPVTCTWQWCVLHRTPEEQRPGFHSWSGV
jgi:hypothetical protein